MKKSLIILASFLFLVGCSEKTRYFQDGVAGEKSEYSTLGIDAVDFEKAASDATQSLLRSGALDKAGGGKYVIAMGRIVNDTTQRIDTDMLIKKIRVAILNSGKAIMTTAVGVGDSVDSMSEDSRMLRGNEEFNQATIAKKGTLIAPDFSLSGKIIQRQGSIDKKKQMVDYYFQLTLTDLKTGLAYWEYESKISKVGSNKTVIW